MKKILVVNDDDDVLETIQLILEIGGYEIVPLNNTKLVFDSINDFKPDLILLDMVLGKIDGGLICSQLKSNAKTKHIPLLILSAFYQLNELESLHCTPDDFMSKPFKMNVLLEKIERLLNRKKFTNYDIN